MANKSINMLKLEKHTLKLLPQYRYECKQQLLVTVMKNGHVCLGADKHYYSVPYRFIGKKVKLLYTIKTNKKIPMLIVFRNMYYHCFNKKDE